MALSQHNSGKSSWQRFVDRGGLWVVGQGVFLLTVFLLGLAYPENAPWPGGFFPGGMILGLGGIMALAGVIRLKSRLTPFPEPAQNSQLVQDGIYALMRHPLYASLMVTSLGWALFQQSWPALMVIPILVFFFDAKARCEERFLRQRFVEYVEYEQRVRRLVPWVY